ncbi:MAG TPA: class I SAM-dependent methyltransferase [Candidatus Sulfotelmatobacter sp.]|jgi:SAM-dependent methyltransferase|nr:class I SAM-dependent methyltransferase [Candidatus Sulfotelmatobacter sp.]
MTEPWNAKLGRIASYYENLVAAYGHDPRACDYGRRSSQESKFSILADALPLDGRSVLDVGCGFADFSDHLRARYPSVVYEGVDITDAMVTQAQARHPDLLIRKLDILESDPGRTYDLVTANGIFYLLGDSAPDFMRSLISRMFALANKAVAFNSLSTWAPHQEPGEFYADPLQIMEFCRSLSPRLVLRHDYLLHDFTIILYKA